MSTALHPRDTAATAAVPSPSIEAVASLRARLWTVVFVRSPSITTIVGRPLPPGKPRGDEWTERNRAYPPADAVELLTQKPLLSGR